jgi:hypothetical protein
MPQGGLKLLNTASNTLFCFTGYQALDAYHKQRKQLDCFALGDSRAIDSLNFCFVRDRKIIIIDTHIEDDLSSMDCRFKFREYMQVVADRLYAYGADSVQVLSFAFSYVSDLPNRYEVKQCTQ